MFSELELDSDYDEEPGFNYKYKVNPLKIKNYMKTISSYELKLFRHKYGISYMDETLPWLYPTWTLYDEIEQRLFYSFKWKYLKWKYSLRKHHLDACRPTRMQLARQKYIVKLRQGVKSIKYSNQKSLCKLYNNNFKIYKELIKRIEASDTWFPTKRNVLKYNTWMNSNRSKPNFTLACVDGICPVLQFLKKRKIFKLQKPSKSVQYSCKIQRKLWRKYLHGIYPI